MSISRTDFIKTVCATGACLCGFGSISLLANNNENSSSDVENQDDNKSLIEEWLSSLLSSFNSEADNEAIKRALKKSSIVHYNDLKMDEMLSEYAGDLDKFISFLENKWGWKVDYDKTTRTIIADENKNYCVCPITKYKQGVNSSAMCYCSEGFAEKMFSKVAGVSASATVISSIRKGDNRCIYKIELS